MEEADRYRCRHIYLKQNNDPAFQAHAACEALANIEGILLAAPHGQHSAHIVYSLDELSFEIVIELLTELDFEMDNSFLVSLRNTIYCYLEDNARDHLPAENPGEPTEEQESPEIPHQDTEQYWDDYH
ncbi:MAG TPA: hypothetical protein VKB27_09295 [Gammaproteobacteria bacterium]|nr:hypothetical protein [Gammaproteobacteria bacterium]